MHLQCEYKYDYEYEYNEYECEYEREHEHTIYNPRITKSRSRIPSQVGQIIVYQYFDISPK